MAFTRDDLRNIGIDDEKIDEVMSLHGKTVQDLKDKKESAEQKFEQAQSEVKLYDKRLKEQNDQLDELRTQVSNGEDLNKQIEALKQANKEKDNEHKAEMDKVKLDYEIDKALDRTGAKNKIAVMALVNKDDVKLSEDGELKGLNHQLEDLKASDSYLFNDTNAEKNSDNKQDAQSRIEDTADYNAGTAKGNHGQQEKEGAVGRKAAERLFGNKNKKEE